MKFKKINKIFDKLDSDKDGQVSTKKINLKIFS